MSDGLATFVDRHTLRYDRRYPHPVELVFEADASYMRFDLEPDGDGTLLHFTLYWPATPGQVLEPDSYPGGDLPAGPDTNWRPGAVGGFHEFLDDLAPYLDGRFTAADRAAQLADVESDRHVHLTEVYREHIRDHCPR